MSLPAPIAYWPFNEGTGTTIADASGNGHTATLDHGTWNTSLKILGAAALANTDGGKAGALTAISLGTTYSLAFWMNGWDGSNDGVLVGTYINSTGLYHDSGVWTHGGLTGAHHIVLTRTGTSATVYKDGTAISTLTIGSGAFSFDTINGQAAGTLPFVGTLDDVRLYNVALTSAQVTELYNLNPDPAGTLTVVQTATGTGTTSASVAMTFATPPPVGQAVVVAIVGYTGATVTSVTDTAGNSYTLAKTQTHASQNIPVHVWYCAVLTATATPLTVTATGAAATHRLGVAMSVSGVGAGLAVDRTAGADSPGAFTLTVGPTAALTHDDVLLVAASTCAGSAASITVGAGPAHARPWVQQAERLALNPVTGEVDTCTLGGALAKTPTVTWSLAAALFASGAIAAFYSTGPALVTVPNVVGLTEAAATTALTAVGLVKGTVTTGPSDTIPAGQVISQSPAAGGSVTIGTAVALVISTGPAHWKLFVDGVDHTAVVNAVSMSWTLNERARMTVTVTNYLPDRLAEVVMYARDGVTPLFGGVILQRHFTGYSQAHPDYKVTCECGDFFTYLDWRSADTTYAAASLKTLLTGIVATYLADVGITLDPGQATGPTVAPVTWSGVRIADGLRELSDQTGWIVKMTPGKVLSMVAPATEAAPFVWSDSAAPSHVQDVDWRDNDVVPVNKIVLVCGPNGLVTIADERHYGDGATRIFPLNSPFVAIIGALSLGHETGGYGVGTYGIDDLPYTYDASLNAIRQRADQPVLLAGQYLWLWYEAQFPFIVEATTGATPVIEHREARQELLSIPAAQAIADALLADLGADPTELHGTTAEDGYEVGQLLTLDLAAMRQLAGPYTIKSVQIDLVLDDYWQYTIEATEGSTRPRATALPQWRDMMGAGRAISGAWGGAPPALVTGLGPSPTEIVKAGETRPSSIVTAGVAAALGGPAFLGGKRSGVDPQDPAAWTPVVDYVVFHAGVSFTAFVRCDLWTAKAGVTAQARLWNLTDQRVAGTSAVIQSVTPVSTIFGVTIQFGHRYRLEVLAGANKATVYGIGTLEAT